MVTQHFITLSPKSRGFHLITKEIMVNIPSLPEVGIFNVFIQHTSAGITINENADPTVLEDFETYYNKIIPEDMPGLKHTIEGPDDMPSHIKSTFTGSNISIPITNAKLNLGVWQGIYLCEFRNKARNRNLIVSIYS